MEQLTEFEAGWMVGLFVGSAHFGGDGKQPQVTLRMDVRRRKIADFLVSRFPGGRLYGPYQHDGRNYWQWMARGRYLEETLLPFLLEHMSPAMDEHTWGRLMAMKDRYFDGTGRIRGLE